MTLSLSNGIHTGAAQSQLTSAASATPVPEIDPPTATATVPSTPEITTTPANACLRQLPYVEGFYREFCSTSQLPNFATKAAHIAQAIDDAHPPTLQGVHRWCRRLQRAGGNPRVLVPIMVQPPLTQPMLPAISRNLTERNDQRGFSARQRPVAAKNSDLLTAVSNNQQYVPDEQTRIRSEVAHRHSRKWSPASNVTAVACRIHDHFRTRHCHRFGPPIGDHVVAACFKMKVRVTDSQGMILGRPWLCVLVDVHTCAVASWELSFTEPCGAKVVCALKGTVASPTHAMGSDLPREISLPKKPKLRDKALTAFAEEHGIALRDAPWGTSDQTSHVERFRVALNRYSVNLIPRAIQRTPCANAANGDKAAPTLSIHAVRTCFKRWLYRTNRLSPRVIANLPTSDVVGAATAAPKKTERAPMLVRKPIEPLE